MLCLPVVSRFSTHWTAALERASVAGVIVRVLNLCQIKMNFPWLATVFCGLPLLLAVQPHVFRPANILHADDRETAGILNAVQLTGGMRP